MGMSPYQAREHRRAMATEWLLVGERWDEDLVILYRSNAYFKSAVDTLVQMLPAMAQGFAAEAIDRQRDIDRQAEMLRRIPPMPLVIDGLFPPEGGTPPGPGR